MTEKLHARLGASNAERWINCPGSVRLGHGIEDRGSTYAREGTAAHMLAEWALTHRRDPAERLGEYIAVPVEGTDGAEGEAFEITEEMSDAVRGFVQEVLSAVNFDSKLWVERKFSLAPFNPPAEMFGTADAIVFDVRARRLMVFDFKYGQGHAVDVIDNAQLKYYGLGALIEIEAEIGPGLIDEIGLVIVQPRASHADGPVRRWSLSHSDLIDFASDLLESAGWTLEPDAPLVPGRWCRFCRAGAVCPARKAEAQAVARVEFAPHVLPEPPAPATLPLPVLVDIMDKLDIVEDWARAVRQHVQGLLERGVEVPGWKLVEKRATRRWKDEAAVKAFAKEINLVTEELYELKLKSPAQLEKVVGKKNLPSELVEKKSSGVNLAPTHDPRPGIPAGPAHDFAQLGAGVAATDPGMSGDS